MRIVGGESQPQPLDRFVWEGVHRVVTRKPGDRLSRVALAVDQVESKARNPVWAT
jgi:hypothetical protein